MPKPDPTAEILKQDHARGDAFVQKLAEADERRNSIRQTPKPSSPPAMPEFPPIIDHVSKVSAKILQARDAAADTEALAEELGATLDAALPKADLRDKAAVAKLGELLTHEQLAKRKLQLLTEYFGEIPELETEIRTKLGFATTALATLAARTAHYMAHEIVETKGLHADTSFDLNPVKSWFGQVTHHGQSDPLKTAQEVAVRGAEIHAELQRLVAEFGVLDFDDRYDFLRNQERLPGGGIADPRGKLRLD